MSNWNRREGLFEGYQGEKLFYQSWTRAGSKASLLITHGQAEHSSCYERLIRGLEKLPLDIYAWDLRGHGRSQGKRGYATHFNDYCLDYLCFLKLHKEMRQAQTERIFTLGHSMGGLIITKSLLDHGPGETTALLLSSPLFGLHQDVSPLKEKAAQLAQRWLPKLTLYNELEPEQLSRDQAVLEEYEKDPLRHDQISAGVYLGFMEAIPGVMQRSRNLTLPCFVQVAEADSVVDIHQAQIFFDRISSLEKKFRSYPGAHHEIYNDIEREKAYADLENFIAKYL